MTSLQSKLLIIGGLLLIVKVSFGFLAYIITKKIEKRAKILKAMQERENKVNGSETVQTK
jgi:hypothetical protein